MRVLCVGNLFPPAANGGYERTWSAAVRGLLAAGHGVRVLTTAPVAGRPVAPGTDPPYVRRELRWYWRDSAFVRPRLRERIALERHNARVLDAQLGEFRPHVVAWWGMGGMSLGLIERVRRAGIPAVGAVGDEWMAYGRRADAWTAAWRRVGPAAGVVERVAGVPARVEFAAAAHWTFASAWLERRARAALGLTRSSVISPGVDPEVFAPAPPHDWTWRLACVGRIVPQKGIATAIEALALLPAATLTVRGDADAGHRAELEALASRLEVAERVAFEPAAAGPVVEAYAAADAILFPVTWAEPWGLVPLEAMSVGRPVVATGTGGSAEYLSNGDNCVLIQPGDARSLAGAVRRLAADEGLRRRLVGGGRVTAAHHTEAAFVSGIVAALEADATRITRP